MGIGSLARYRRYILLLGGLLFPQLTLRGATFGRIAGTGAAAGKG